MLKLLERPQQDSGNIVITPETGRLGIYDSVEDYLKQDEILKHNERVRQQQQLSRRHSRKISVREFLHLIVSGRLRPIISGGAAGAWTFTDVGRTDLLNGTYDLDSDTFKMALLLQTSNIGAATTTYAGVTNEHANANGYTTGGVSITLTLSGTTTVTVDIATDPVWTASGGSIVARFAAIYEVGGRVLCYALLDSTPADVTVTTGNTLTVAASASGVFTLA